MKRFRLLLIVLILIGAIFAAVQYPQFLQNSSNLFLCNAQTHNCKEVATFGGSGVVRIRVSNISAPLGGVQVDIFEGTNASAAPENTTFMTNTDKDGIALLRTVPEGSYVVFLPPIEGYDVPPGQLVYVNDSQTVGTSFTLLTKGTPRDCASLAPDATEFGNLTVQVLGNGQPVGNLEVDLGLQPGPNNCPKKTDSNGLVSFENIPVGSMAIFFNGANFPKEFSQASSAVYWVNITKNQTFEKTIELSQTPP